MASLVIAKGHQVQKKQVPPDAPVTLIKRKQDRQEVSDNLVLVPPPGEAYGVWSEIALAVQVKKTVMLALFRGPSAGQPRKLQVTEMKTLLVVLALLVRA